VRNVGQIDSSGKIVTVSNDTSAKFWSVPGKKCILTTVSHDDCVQDVSVLHENAVVTVGDDAKAVITQVSDGAELASYKFDSNIQTCSASNSNTFFVGDKSGTIYQLTFDSAAKKVQVVNEINDAHEDTIFGSYAHGGTFATASYDNTVKLWTSRLVLMHTFRGHTSWAMCVEYDDTYLVSGAADNTVRVYRMNDFKHVCTIRRQVTSGFGRIMCVAISKDSNIVVSGGDDQIISLHALPSGDFIAKYNIHMFIHGMTILSNGHLAVVGHSPHDVKVFKIDELPEGEPFDDSYVPPVPVPPQKQTSVMEEAFMTVLKKPDSLDIPFIEKIIQRKNINSAADLFCGHNLLLLAIRTKVLSRQDILKFKGNQWFFQDNLYYPASQLTNESGKMLYPIFHHAQDIGFIEDGHKFRMNHEERLITESQIERLEESVMELSRRMNRIEARVDNISVLMDSVEKQVERNTENFQNLFAAIKKKEKYMAYAGGAKIVLSLIPFVGNALANTAYEGANVALAAAFDSSMMELGAVGGMVGTDMIGAGVDISKGVMESVVRKKTKLSHAQVDLSNMAVAYFMVSAQGLATMDEQSQEKLKASIAKSDFKSIEKLRILLKTMMRENAAADDNIRRLDNGENLRTPTVSSRKPPVMPAVSRNNPESSAINYFRAKAAGLGTETIPFHDAWDALTQALITLRVRKEVSEEEFDEMFMDISEDDEVSEEDFLKVFRLVIKDVPIFVDEARIKREFSEVFRGKLRKDSGYARSARVMRVALEKMKAEGKLNGVKLMPESDIKFMFEEWDQDHNGKIDEREFVDAGLLIARGFAN